MVAGFEELARRLLAQARAAVRRGEVSERGLAKLCGYSQPHLHNVLAGVRGLQPGLADRLLAALELSLLDLHTAAERAVEDPEAAPRATSSRIPLLEGPLGAGGPFPRKPWRPRHLNLPFLNPAPAANPVAAVVSSLEGAMWPAVSPGDLVVLERSPAIRRSPTFGGVYAIYWRGRGYLRRCQRVGQALMLAVDQEMDGEGPPPRLEPGSRGLPHYVRGRVVWLARDVPLENYEDDD